jgi:hypothetical protein
VGFNMVQTGNLLPKTGALWGLRWYRLVIVTEDRDFVGCHMVQTGNLLPKIEPLWVVICYRLVICYRRYTSCLMLHSVVWNLVLSTFYLLTVSVGVILHLVTLSDTLSKTALHEGSILRRDPNLTTHNTHKTNIHVPSGMRAHNSSKRAAAHTRLKLCGDHRVENITVNIVYGRK